MTTLTIRNGFATIVAQSTADLDLPFSGRYFAEMFDRSGSDYIGVIGTGDTATAAVADLLYRIADSALHRPVGGEGSVHSGHSARAVRHVAGGRFWSVICSCGEGYATVGR